MTQVRAAGGAATVSRVRRTCRRIETDKSALDHAFASRRWVRSDRVGAAEGSRLAACDRSGAAVARARHRCRACSLDGASGPRLSALALAVLIQQQAGIEVGAAVLVAGQAAAHHSVGVARRVRAGCAEPACRHRRRAVRWATTRTRLPWSMSTPSVSSTPSRG